MVQATSRRRHGWMGVEVNALEAGLFIRKLVDFDSNWKKKTKKTYLYHASYQ